MTLALTINWSQEFVAVTIVDAAARTIVAEARALQRIGTPGTDGAEIWWAALNDATRTALDGLAVLNLTTEDIRTIELSGDSTDAADAADGAGSTSVLAMLLEPAPTGRSGQPIGNSSLSASAATSLGLPAGCPITLGPSFERSLGPGDQDL